MKHLRATETRGGERILFHEEERCQQIALLDLPNTSSETVRRKPYSLKQFSWAGLLASGFVIVEGFVSILFVVLVFSDAQRCDVAIVVAVFVLIGLIPVLSLRTPRDPAEKQNRGWWKF